MCPGVTHHVGQGFLGNTETGGFEIGVQTRELRIAGEVPGDSGGGALALQIPADRSAKTEIIQLRRPQVERETAHLVEARSVMLTQSLMPRSRNRGSDPGLSFCRWILSAVSTWPISSCSSRAMRRRSVSWTSRTRLDSARNGCSRP